MPTTEKLPYSYNSSGIQLSSELPFPELREHEGKADVTIRLGKVPERLENITSQGALHQISGDSYLLDIRHAARYLLKNNEIIIEPYPGVETEAVRLYLLSSVFGMLVHAHDMLPLHSCCLKVNGSAVVVCGSSGAGKSTLALGMYRKGYEILNDDMSAISFDKGGNPVVHPGYIHLKLWAESLEKYGYEPDQFRKLRNELEKFSFPIQRTQGIEPTPLKAIFLIESQQNLEIRKELLKGMATIKQLRQHTFRYKLVKGINKTAEHFKLCSDLAVKVPVFKVTRPANIRAEEFAIYMEEQFNAL